jgi:hypothetical protein
MARITTAVVLWAVLGSIPACWGAAPLAVGPHGRVSEFAIEGASAWPEENLRQALKADKPFRHISFGEV